MEIKNISNTLTIIISILTFLSGLSVLLGQTCTNLVTTGFLAYILNIFSAPILMIFPLLFNISTGIWVIYPIIISFMIFGIIAFSLAIYESKKGSEKFVLISRFIISCLACCVAIIIIISLCTYGLSPLQDVSFWASFYIILFLIFIIWNFVLRLILTIIKEPKN